MIFPSWILEESRRVCVAGCSDQKKHLAVTTKKPKKTFCLGCPNPSLFALLLAHLFGLNLPDMFLGRLWQFNFAWRRLERGNCLLNTTYFHHQKTTKSTFNKLVMIFYLAHASAEKIRSHVFFAFWKGGQNYCWWKKSCTTWDVKFPVNNGDNYLWTGAGFLPSTVSWQFLTLPFMIFENIKPTDLRAPCSPFNLFC